MSVGFFELDIEDLRRHLLKYKLTGEINEGINAFRLISDGLYIVVNGNDFLVLRRLSDGDEVYIRLESSNKDLLFNNEYSRKRSNTAIFNSGYDRKHSNTTIKALKNIRKGYLETDRYLNVELSDYSSEFVDSPIIEYKGINFSFESYDYHVITINESNNLIQYEAEIKYELRTTSNKLKFSYGLDKEGIKLFDLWETYGIWVNYEEKVGLSMPRGMCLSNESGIRPPVGLENKWNIPVPLGSVSEIQPPVSMVSSPMTLMNFILKYIPYAGIQIIKGDSIVVTIDSNYGKRSMFDILEKSGLSDSDNEVLFNSTDFTVGCSGKYINIFVKG